MPGETFLVERLGHLGDGIATAPDGSAIFAPRTLPGEVIAGDLSGHRIEAPRIVVPSPQRVAPPCPHYRACGGCALQHASDGFVARWKSDVVRQALAARGLAAEVAEPLVSPPASRRRATLSGRRTKKGAIVGFHGRASDVITGIPSCRVVDPAILAALPACEALVLAGASRKAELALSVTVSDAGPDVAVSGGKPLDGPLRRDLAGLGAQHDLARLTWNGEELVVARAPGHAFGPARVCPPPGAFLQATPGGQAALARFVTGALDGARRVADLFAGCGTFSLPLARQAEVHAVESAPDLLAALDRAWRGTSGLRRVTTEPRDLFRRPLLADELARFDAVVLDPPRAGAEAQAHEIAASRLSRVVMVSCNPVSFARDLRVLCDAGLVPGTVQVVDQFRWSAHVELAVALSRGHIAGT